MTHSNPVVFVVSIAIVCTESLSLQDVGNRGSKGKESGMDDL